MKGVVKGKVKVEIQIDEDLYRAFNAKVESQDKLMVDVFKGMIKGYVIGCYVSDR